MAGEIKSGTITGGAGFSSPSPSPSPKPRSSVSHPPPVDYSAALMVASENQKTIALGQIMTQRFALQQAAMDRQLQLAGNLELSLERYDTRLQTTKLDYLQAMQAEENRHAEALASQSRKLNALGIGAATRPAGSLELLDEIEEDLLNGR